MPSILHRLTIDAPPERVYDLAATRKGIQRWWTTRPVAGDDSVGGRLEVYFSNQDRPAAVFEVLERTPQRIVWRYASRPGVLNEHIKTLIESYRLRRDAMLEAQARASFDFWRSDRALTVYDDRARELLFDVGLTGFADTVVSDLSYGLKRALEFPPGCR